MVKIDMEAIKRSSVPERVQLVQEIWDTLQPTVEQLPLTEEQEAVVDRRLEEHRRDPSSAIPWDEVKARLESEQVSRYPVDEEVEPQEVVVLTFLHERRSPDRWPSR